MNVVLIQSSVRDGRLGPSIVSRVKPFLERKKWKLHFIDPMDFNLPLLFQRYYEMKSPSDEFQLLHSLLVKADGFILVTAEYNHSIPPALKNFLDHFLKEYAFKACGIVSYSDGAYGGVRAAEHLRLVCTNLKMPPITEQPAISFAGKRQTPDQEKAFKKVMKKFLDQFEWYMEAFRARRKKGLPG
ncbi:MAG: NAD(P)H-dependent oxidoreductase [Bacteroidota bacterium]